MDDSFSLFAKSIRQKKINKDELLNNLRQISDAQNKKDQYIKNVLKIQKVIRGHIYRKKYRKSLEEINTRTVIDYLLEKKKNRIHKHSIEIISFFISKYVNRIRKNRKSDMLFRQYKIHCINLIKARLRGILVRKHIKKELYLIRKAKKMIFKNILAYRTKLILKSSTIQNLLIDIAKIKYQLKNLDKDKDILKIKELKNKLSKNKNLFYDTYYYTKENCNWVLEKKTTEKWFRKYFDIINKKPEKKEEKNKKGNTYNGNNRYTNYLVEYYNDTDDDNDHNNNNEYKHKFLTSNNKSNINSTVNSTKIKNLKSNDFRDEKKYKDISEFKIEEIKEENVFSAKKERNKKSTKFDDSTTSKKYNKNFSNTCRSCKEKNSSDIKAKNNVNVNKEEKKKLKNEINDIDLNNINNKISYYIKDNNRNYKKSSTNIYHQREERPIKPLNKNNIMNCENPFGTRENNFQKTHTLGQPRNYRNSMQNINEYNKYHKKNTVDHRNKESNRQSNGNDDSQEFGRNRIYSGRNNNYGNSKFVNKDDKPVGGGKKIDYEAMFGDGSKIKFEGDPFGGAKQFETNKSKIHQKSNSVAVRKKPIYDARKAIEEAKLKEAKEGKKEKHNEFRDFLREMKKMSKNEKNLNKTKKNGNNNNNNNKINSGKSNYVRNNNSIELKKNYIKNLNEIENGNGAVHDNTQVYQNNIYTEYNNNKHKISSKKREVNFNIERSLNKSSSRMLRKKLHDLEKAPAPILNIKGAKSKIECWFDSNSNNNGSKYKEYSLKSTFSNKSNGQKKIKKIRGVNKSEENEENNRTAISRKWENKIEDYVDKKLSQLHLQIVKIDDIFSIESYFEQKKRKMKKYKNIPYINESNFYVKKYSNDIYDELINDVNKEYKNLK